MGDNDQNSGLENITGQVGQALDEFSIIHGMASALSADELEQFKEYMAARYPVISEERELWGRVRDHPHFKHAFCNLLPPDGVEYAKKYLIRKKPEVYEALREFRLSPIIGEEINYSDRASILWLD